MCTVSWLHESAGYQVFFNRDEKRARQPAEPPRLDSRDGVRFLAPRDGDFGGAWLFVNAFGVTAGVLNYYPEQAVAPRGPRRSRGLLLLDLAASRRADDMMAHLCTAALAPYAPFTLVAFGLGEPTCMAAWDGRLLQVPGPPVASPLSSSSCRTEEVVSSRLNVFRHWPTRGRTPADRLRDFHCSHVPERGLFSVCMHRADAQTVSFSHIQVDTGWARFRYQPGSPCEGRPAATSELAIEASRA
ncbi:MAG: NRDE family protein [Lentisphaerae bacterium]|nr:NRDE family protein [Lentisphaerota bacterium]